MQHLVLIVHDIRSAHNVGSILRTADGLGVDHVYLTGFTPYPATAEDARLPHIAAKMTRAIHKTALGAEVTTKWSHETDIYALLNDLRGAGFNLIALEQSPNSISLNDFKPPVQSCLILGREVEGIAKDLLDLVDTVIEIPMHGAKESLNVAQAAAIALYQIKSKVYDKI